MSLSHAIAAATAMLLVFPVRVHAAAADYEFQPVAVEVKNGPGAELLVRLVHKPSGNPVAEALIVKTRLDMAPDDMEAMTAKHSQAEPAGPPGVYRFKADLTMAGQWALKLMAKIQGERETVIGTVIFTAME
ncbi:MAG: FixH family protein [Hyphomicrobiaceae bacterium]